MSGIYAPVAVYATRYALGRRTAAPADVADFILAHRDDIRADAGCRDAIIRDIREQAALGYGAECDRDTWVQVLHVLGGAA